MNIHHSFCKNACIAILTLSISSAMYGQDSIPCYKVSQVNDNIWTIVENNTVNIYLVEGTDSALVIDTGYGTGDLSALVKSLTKLPLIVVNTHGHGDHIGADHQFSKVYIHPEDVVMANTQIKQEGPSLPLSPVREGYIFDLGGRRLEVIEVPGHSLGSICLLDSANKILFSGDNTNALVWLFLKNCCPLEVYLKTLEKVEQRLGEFHTIMPGHNTPLEGNFIQEQIACVQSILNGTCSSVPYNYSSFTQGAMLCKFKTAEVAFDPNNLFVKPETSNDL
jgi:hydroxyacylglutathione hydrolase